MLTPQAAVFSLLFASGEPFDKGQLAALVGLDREGLAAALSALAGSLDESGVVLVETETEVELRTAPEAAAVINKFREQTLARDLGKASLETLSIIAYQEGASRGEIDWVRGVNSSASLRTLLLRGLIEGRKDEHDKRRIRYYLTTEALAHLGLRNADELPRKQELSLKIAAIVKEVDYPSE